MRETPVDRRTVLAGGSAVVAALAGCISTSPTPPGSAGGSAGSDDSGGSSNVEPLTAGGSSTVYPIASKAASYWASNAPPDDEEYWGPAEFDIQTEQSLADYWGSLYGFDPDTEGPPYAVNVGISHSGTGLEKLKNGQIDMGNASAPVAAELTNASEEELSKFTDHVVGVDAQPIVVSKQVYDAGVTKLTADQVRGIYTGEITNWTGIPSYTGPDREIQAVGRAEGSGTDTAFRVNMLGGANANMSGIDVRKGENQQVKALVQRSNNAIAYMALAFVDGSVPAVALEFKGKTYEPGKNLAEKNYPLSRDLHMYTYEGTSKKEAAFLRMIISGYGQQTFVKPEGYSMLPPERRKKQLDVLPETES